MRGRLEDRARGAAALKALLALLLALCLVAEASAQMGSKRGRRGPDGSPKATQRETADLFQVTLEELRVDLKLTAEQEPLWDAYARKLEALKTDIARQRSRERTAAATQGDAPHELDRLADTQRDRLTATEDIAEAGKALYKALGPEQKSIADARLAKLVATASAEPAGRAPSSAAK